MSLRMTKMSLNKRPSLPHVANNVDEVGLMYYLLMGMWYDKNCLVKQFEGLKSSTYFYHIYNPVIALLSIYP